MGPSRIVPRFFIACSRARLYAWAALLARTDACSSGSLNALSTAGSACFKKNGSEKNSGSDSYTNVDTSRMRVGE